VIIDVGQFIGEEQPHWKRLENLLDRMENDSALQLNLEEIGELHYLYQRATSDLSKLMTFASEPEVRGYLESLVARAYGEIHQNTRKTARFSFRTWWWRTFPETFRKHIQAFWLSLAITLAGAAFGALALYFDPEAKEILMPFPHLLGSPSERVAKEESGEQDSISGHASSFSAQLMTHNTQVALTTLALGFSWGIGTLIVLFYNGIILGAVILDYIRDGQSIFLAGWLLPHGTIEIPAILMGGQAGLVLAHALIGWGTRDSLRARFRKVGPDLITMTFGIALLLVWAGIIESFLSQKHQPEIPYSLKIGFGLLELGLLIWFLAGLSKRAFPSRGELEDPK
jgi:uncharacterized membrane protein SpoIIM required for sporulation